LAEKPPIKKYVDTERIFEILNVMIETTIRAIAEADVEAARLALSMDDEIDDLYEQIQRELLTYMMENPKLIGQATKLLRHGALPGTHRRPLRERQRTRHLLADRAAGREGRLSGYRALKTRSHTRFRQLRAC
jgi:phosphate transport system protein